MSPVEIRRDVGKLADVIRAAKARAIAIDGCDGAGKTTLANALASFLGCTVIDLDDYLNKNRGSFVPELKLDELRVDLKATGATDKGLIISGVFVLDVLERADIFVDFIVYVERRSKHDIPGDLYILKHEEDEEFSVSEDVPLNDLQRELCQYHRKFKPRSRADVIFVREPP